MLDVKYIRNNLETVKEKTAAKGINIDFNFFVQLDKRRRKYITEVESFKSRKKKIAQKTGLLKRNGEDTAELEFESKNLSQEISSIEGKLKKLEEQYKDFLLNIPNLFDDSVPIGKDEKDNKIISEWGEKPEFDFTPIPHWELGEENKFLDFNRATKMSGSRFVVYFDKMAKLERVLINFMLDLHTTENGYTEVLPPFLVNDRSLTGTGNLPKFKDDLYKIEHNNLYLIPTAEVPLTNLHREENIEWDSLPRNYVASTPCFRSEAGSYGKDIRGIIRQHQFNKVELLKFVEPEKSLQELENLTKNAEFVLQKLNLCYRIVLLCSGDMSFSSAKTYDIEVWMPARKGFVEISSCSNFSDFQARRAKIRYRSKDGQSGFVHTINGSGLAVGRTLAAIMENYQTPKKQIRIPPVLKPYFNNEGIF